MSEQNQPGPDAPVPPSPQPGGTADAGGGLQFDRAEFANRPAKKCTACKGGIQDAYFTINGAVICGNCCQTVQAQPAAGSGMRRFIKAAIFGSIAAALGCGIYLAVLWGTGYEVGIIAILVGWMVGKAVNNGSGKRGGRVYQCLAVFLTYTAIASSYLPLIVSEMMKLHDKEKAATAKAGDTKAVPAKTVAAPAPAGKEASTAVAVPNTDTENAEEAGTPAPARLGVLGFLFALFVLLLFAFALPFLAGFQNIVGLIIIGIGLYEAWVMNRRVVLDIKGPFPIAPPSPAEASPSGA